MKIENEKKHDHFLFGLDAVVVRERYCTCDAFLLFLEYPV